MTKEDRKYHNILIWIIIFCGLQCQMFIIAYYANLLLSKALRICFAKLIKACVVE